MQGLWGVILFFLIRRGLEGQGQGLKGKSWTPEGHLCHFHTISYTSNIFNTFLMEEIGVQQ